MYLIYPIIKSFEYEFDLVQGSADFYYEQDILTEKRSSLARLIEKRPLQSIVFLKFI